MTQTDTMDRTEIERRAADAVGSAFGIPESDVRASGFSLSGSRAFSSFALLEVVLRLEEAFSIDIPDHDLDLKNFDSLGAIADYVGARLGNEGRG